MNLVLASGVLLASIVARSDTPICSNQVVAPDESCDRDNQISGDGCDATYRLERISVCGNGVKEGDEECDDGNLVNGDSCDSTCHLERGCCCGNGALDPGEECDDGNDVDNDGCSTACKIDPMWRRQSAQIRNRAQGENHEYDRHRRRYADLLQESGQGTARRLQPWLAL